MEMEREKRELEKEAGLTPNHGSATDLQSEADLRDHHEHDHDHESDDDQDHDHDHHEHEQAGYSNLAKDQLLKLTKELLKEDDFKKVDRTMRELKHAMDEIRGNERTTALNRFILDGGVADDFTYKSDETDIEFDSTSKKIRDRRTQFLRGLEDKKNDNLKKKLELLEKLRDLVDTEDVADQFEQFKKLQGEWKNTGPVPGVQARSLWANYHALVDRFYDNQSIYFELKELDRKKNLEAKQELCVRAENLAAVEKIKAAIKELNELHHEFKHVGPVPMEEKEAVWQRFKAASDAVYTRRDEFLKHLQVELGANLEQKNKLCDEVALFAEFNSDRIKEWNQKTREILELQKKWEAVGGLPRAKAKEVNKRFWSSFKAFFSNKNAFFKKLDEGREQNLKLKEELVKRALELKDSADWDKTTNELKNIQARWKEIGPVPEKVREKIFKEFKEACDHFFDKKREQFGKKEEQQHDNLKAKEEICATLEQGFSDGEANIDVLRELEEKFNEIGFVPRKDISNIRTRYHEAIQKYVAAIDGLTEIDRSKLVLESQLLDLKNDPASDRKLFQKEQAIRKKISKVENDIALWRNNLEFFAHSKNADKVRDDFNEKIHSASDHLKQLKEQLKMLRAVS